MLAALSSGTPVVLGEAAPRLWRTVKLDYSAANAFLATHYGRETYFPAATAEEPIFDGRRGVFDDAQGVMHPATLGTCGFALHHSASAVTDWSDLEQLRRTYIPELREVLLEAFAPRRIEEVVFTWHMSAM